jgi:hypothetical protein
MFGLFRRIGVVLLIVGLFALPANADRIGVLVSEVDADPAGYAITLTVPNGSLGLTDGVATLTLAGSGDVLADGSVPFASFVDVHVAGVRLTGDGDGAITFLGLGDGSDEDLTLNFDDTANTVVASSSTGVTDIDFSAFNLVTTGSISGGVKIVVTTDGSESPTAGQMYGTAFIADHATATSDTDYTLPAAAAGMSACFYDNGAGTGGIIIDAAAGDEILLNGTGIGAAEAIDSPGVAGDGANGDFICLLAIDATSWITLGQSGTWVDGGAD